MPDPDVLVAGEALVDFLPDRSGPLRDVEMFSRRAGGAPANVAIALARLDERPWFLSNLSTDAFGEFLADTLAAEGIPERFLTCDEEHRTTLAFVSHDTDADRSFEFYRTATADQHIDPSVVKDDALRTISWVVLGGVALASEPARTRLLDFAERAREHGCTIVLDPNRRPELWPDAATYERVLSKVLTFTDICKVSDEDLVSTRFADESLDSLLDAGPHTVVSTRGANGAHVVAGEDASWGPDEYEHGGYAVDPADTTGAGDAFLAGVLYGLTNGEPIDEALAFANAVAALTTTEQGAIAALPDREAVAAFRDSSV
ncbi:carbohydrate kinase family protein [Halococcus qingdaonensis]|uniref:carbohydrate kinase family protein n=1 Tax=Halococcus qingdaonensis TaxID=224402 RepID=UPI0021160FDE|nr:carbohydrate kinase [Halococcus qingdaonensis]